MALIFAYALFEDPSVLKFRFGMIFTAIIFALIGSPFLRLVSKKWIYCFRVFSHFKLLNYSLK